MDITKLTAIETKEIIKKRELSVKELIGSYLDKIDSVDKEINAFITLNREEALKNAEKLDKKIKNGQSLGALGGLPIGIKDNIVTKDLKTTCGSKMLENFIPPYDGKVVEKIKKEDGIILGKLNLDEFAMGSSTETSYFGETKNPINMEMVPGGSSGGSAAAVKAGEVLLSLGTDTGGSTRQPAAFCDVVGIKPSYGLVSRYGIVSLANTLDTVGVLGKDVEDAAFFLSTLTGFDPLDSTSSESAKGETIRESIVNKNDINTIKGMKVGLPKEFFQTEIDKGISREVNKAIKILESLGAEIEEISMPYLEYSLAVYHVIVAAEISSNLARFDGIRYGHRSEDYNTLDELYINSRTEALGEEVKRRIMFGTYYLSKSNANSHYERALKIRRLIKEDFDRAFGKYDILLSPTSPILPFKFGEKMTNPLSMYKADLFTVPVNLGGLCAMSIPCGYENGLPVGLQIIGDRFKEANIIKAGLALEGGLKNGI
ncbi:MAG: Asp-tRNA(Asn)/Glu-tRNA(Gln) amidotransferase subunit GatA [Tissierellaceae bacterium]|nr:Asp-tRNA(Asn)/Glu-tRNA(Gln) amidotransferase subunit GatA [Tissierellaceae bacterium]